MALPFLQIRLRMLESEFFQFWLTWPVKRRPWFQVENRGFSRMSVGAVQ